MSRTQAQLFSDPAPLPPLPEGMRYQPDFLSPAEEHALIRIVAALPVKEMNYRGYTARRRVLEPLRRKVAGWLGVAPEAFTQVLAAEYREGTPLGWHRDVPQFEDVVGVSLLNEAVLKFRPWPPREPKKADVIRLVVAPRSIYLLRGPARWAWQHSVAPTRTLRYSITFRTSRHSRTDRRP